MPATWRGQLYWGASTEIKQLSNSEPSVRPTGGEPQLPDWTGFFGMLPLLSRNVTRICETTVGHPTRCLGALNSIFIGTNSQNLMANGEGSRATRATRPGFFRVRRKAQRVRRGPSNLALGDAVISVWALGANPPDYSSYPEQGRCDTRVDDDRHRRRPADPNQTNKTLVCACRYCTRLQHPRNPTPLVLPVWF